MGETSNVAQPDWEAELASLKRKAKRQQKKAYAEGYMAAVTAMLGPKDLVLDCGANMGLVTERLAATGAQVIAYEPDPYAFSILQEKFAQTPNVTLVNAAVGVGAGRIRLSRAVNFDENPVGASVKSTILQGGRGVSEEAGVEVELLDFPGLLRDLFAKHGEIAFVKMDIEGAELEILEVMQRDGLFSCLRAMVVETHEHKFKELRPRYRALREAVAAEHPTGRINLDWI